MGSFTNSILVTGLLGFLTGWIGIFTGMLISSFVKYRGKRFRGTILGVVGGIMLGIVCFDLLPEAFESGTIFLVIAGLTIGLIFAVSLDGKLEHDSTSTSCNKNNCFFKAAVFMAIGIAIHNIPTGIALGSLIIDSPVKGLQLAIALIFDGIPEGLTLGILLSGCNAGKYKLLLLSIFTSIPLGAGAMLGGILKSSYITCISLSFASALILYVTLRETLPAANDTWSGRTTTIGNVLGMIIGLLIIFGFC